MSGMERWIAKHQRRLAVGRFLERFAEWFGAFLFAFGSVVLVAKLMMPSLWPQVLWLSVAALPITLAAWMASRRDSYSRTESIAMIDRKLGAEGLLMALCETPDAEWAGKLPVESAWEHSLPQWRPVRFARYVTFPVLFAVAACLIPPREARTEVVRPNAVGRNTAEQLQETLSLLQEANILDEKEERQLEEAIKKLSEETEQTPLTHEKWEAVDALRERLKMRAESASLLVAQGAEAAALLASAEEGDGEPMSAERRERLEKEMLEALKKLSAGGNLKGLSPELAKKLARLTAGQKLQLPADAQERAKTLGELKELLASESKKLSECRSKCCAQCNGKGCQECQGNALAQCEGNRPGRGGVSRGRGDAELTWGKESDDQDSRFKEVALPPGFLDQPQDDVTGVTLAPPEVDPATSAPREALRSNNLATGKETWNRRLRPRHQAVVRKYFDSKTPSGTGNSSEKSVP